MKIEGQKAEKYFENESGKITLQRVPPTESKGRRHTSIISIAILPEYKREASFNINDLRIEFYKASGKGGQKRNKTENACRIVHVPTGLIVCNADQRHKEQNREIALKVMKERLQKLEEEKAQKDYNQVRQAQISDGGRSDKTRTYSFIDGFVHDHSSGVKTNKIKDVMKGHFEVFYVLQ